MNKTILILIISFSIHLWQISFLQDDGLKVINMIGLSLILFTYLELRKKRLMHKPLYSLTMNWFIVGILISTCSTYLFRGQSPYNTFTIYLFGGYYFLFIYYLLSRSNISIEYIEKIFIVFGILYLVFHTIQYLAYPVEIFHCTYPMKEDRGTIRFKIEGSAFATILYFLSVNRFLELKRNKYLFIAIACFVVFFLQGFRTLLLAYAFCSFLLAYPYLNRKNIIYLSSFLIILLIILKATFLGSIFEEMLLQSEMDQESGDENIRVLEFFYFTGGDFMKEWYYFLFGGGMPGNSEYGSFIRNQIEGNYSFYWMDLGLIGFYLINGVLITLSFLWLSTKSVLIKLPTQFRYVRYFFLYLLISSFVTMEIFREGVFGVIALALYVCERASNYSISKTKKIR